MILYVEGIRFGYNGEVTLKDIEFELKRGRVCAILGENGAGKTTLLKCIDGVLKPRVGTVYVEKKNLAEMSKNEIAKYIGYVPQRYSEGMLTVFDTILLGRKPYIRWDVSRRDIGIVEDTIQKMGLENISLKRIDEISGGELQKVIIARALVQQPKVLLLDEPTNNLDIRNQIEVMRIIKEIVAERDMSAVVALHDINLAMRYADDFLILKNGKILSCGGFDTITPENIKRAYGIEAEIVSYRDVPLVVPLDS
ncbi:MAG: ABC transporter ATP-binding protein [Synergistetes bacterium]|nr:ABC transporter ATP-binding protein [Synergistota bacterium]